MKRYLLDTCICVFLFRQKYGIAEKLDAIGASECFVRALGTPIDDFDLLIAASAYANNLVLVTDNLKHFQNIEGLTVENWVKR